jgi:GH43 family beta-xylosidase
MRKKIIAALTGLSTIIILGGIMLMKNKNLEPLALREVENSDAFYKNPLGVTNIGDPFIIKAADGKYYCYATSSHLGFKVWASSDFTNWQDKGLAYTADSNSFGKSEYWAPEVVEHEGKYYMYYTARWKKNDSLRIGVAISHIPTGPFEDVSDKPMFDFGYAAIDGNVLIDDDGKKYFYYSRDCSENIVDGRHESHIYAAELNDDMISLKGEAVQITKPDQYWEKLSDDGYRWNEGPVVFKKNNLYYLMYSANFFASKSYSVGYATSTSPLGPFRKYENNPVLSAVGTEVSGPGHNNIFMSPDGKEMLTVYHTHTNPAEGGGNRQLNIDRMGFRADGSLYVNGPTITYQIKPSGINDMSNIAKEAQVSVSSSKQESISSYVTDGEINIYRRSEKYLWYNDVVDKEPWVKLDWGNKKTIHTVLIYYSSDANKRPLSGRLILSNGKVIENINIPKKKGEASVLNFDPQQVQWIKFVAEIGDNEEIGISEIMVIE